MLALDPVRFRDCACPGTPHVNGDTVTFKSKLTFDENVAAYRAIFSGEGIGQTSKAWGVYLHAGPVAWNLLDEEGKAVPLTTEALDALPFEDQFEIADRADDIYGETVLAPLVRTMKRLSATGPTGEASNQPTPLSSKRRARSRRSSEPSSDPSLTTSETL